jgi:hypothetical protein
MNKILCLEFGCPELLNHFFDGICLECGCPYPSQNLNEGGGTGNHQKMTITSHLVDYHYTK